MFKKVPGKTDFTVYRTGNGFTMAYNCGACGKPVLGHGDDAHGKFTGTCPNGHESIMFTS